MVVAKEEPVINIDGDQMFYDVNQTAQVRARVRQVAQQIATKAITIDKKENGGNATITLVDRTTGRGRAVTEVHSDDAAGEYGTSTTARRRTLRRAAGAVRK